MGQLCGAWKIQGCWDWEKERGGRRGNWVRARNESQGTLFTINVCEKGWKMSGKEGRQRGKSFGGGFRMGCNGVCQPLPAFTVEWYKGDRRSLQGLAWIHLQAGCLPARILHFTLGWIIKSFSDGWKTPSAQFETSLGCFKKTFLASIWGKAYRFLSVLSQFVKWAHVCSMCYVQADCYYFVPWDFVACFYRYCAHLIASAMALQHFKFNPPTNNCINCLQEKIMRLINPNV